MTIRIFAFCWILIAGSLLLSQPLHAQNLSGSITGVVHDATGAIVPGVQIVLINQDQGTEARRTITNEAGIYLFSALPGATYTLTADLPGFKKYTQKDVKLFVNDKLGLPPIVLEVGTTAETVTVEAESVQLQTVSAERFGIVTGRQMDRHCAERTQFHEPAQNRARGSRRCGRRNDHVQWPTRKPK
jgi:hypothetical protein